MSLRALITVFEEVERYDSLRHHNQPPPALWIDEAEYLRDVKDLVHELRRLNDLLEAEATEVSDKDIARTSSLVGEMAHKACMTAAAVIGGSVAALLVASVYTLLSYTDAGAEVLSRLPMVGNDQ